MEINTGSLLTHHCDTDTEDLTYIFINRFVGGNHLIVMNNLVASTNRAVRGAFIINISCRDEM